MVMRKGELRELGGRYTLVVYEGTRYAMVDWFDMHEMCGRNIECNNPNWAERPPLEGVERDRAWAIYVGHNMRGE